MTWDYIGMIFLYSPLATSEILATSLQKDCYCKEADLLASYNETKKMDPNSSTCTISTIILTPYFQTKHG